ncbi:hypothetical protein Lfu02_42250 [Longispora fulva]|uniref:Uncharacterized protein n=1 Tax=Longispora fulva TaxID=619741 RepID=A0A8J7GGC1_9ACTN|nr:hypothetical protein [Longispora fulva]MBG6136685.1 hypothetical protein [Longispora fulva]GIG59853.1 hypothetical protein Lfu02_42250 [Longispora fulva]
MTIVTWPVVSRDRVVRAFKPGGLPGAEAPFRTLRSHRWASAGVRVSIRAGGRLDGQRSLFSSLNVESALLARHGREDAARRVAQAAETLEAGPEFARLKELLAAVPVESADAVLEGRLPSGEAGQELGLALRAVARRTEHVRAAETGLVKVADVVAGQVTEVHEGYVVLSQLGGPSTAVPRWMAVAAHRDQPGAWLILITDRLADASAFVNAVPGISLGADPSPEPFTPFGRASQRARVITEADAAVLSGSPVPLTVVVPVVIEA